MQFLLHSDVIHTILGELYNHRVDDDETLLFQRAFCL